MTKVNAYATPAAKSELGPLTIERRTVGPHDVQIEILYCGVCHSDIHQARNEWGNAVYPMVPGHEIVGRVTAVGLYQSQHCHFSTLMNDVNIKLCLYSPDVATVTH